MIALPDVNVLVAIAWPSHVHHDDATRWFKGVAGRGWATSSVTELGFVRMCMNPAAVGRGIRAGAAIEMLGKLRRVGAHEFWQDDVSALDLAPMSGRLQGYRQVTDAHLTHLATMNGGTLATFDRAVSAIAGDEDHVTVLARRG